MFEQQFQKFTLKCFWQILLYLELDYREENDRRIKQLIGTFDTNY